MKWSTNIDNERHMFLDRYYFSRRNFLFDDGREGGLENMPEHSCDGMEDRMIAKDLLYKFEDYLRSKGHQGINLKARLKETGHWTKPIQAVCSVS